jgi:rhamnosyltransferase subunit B
VGPDPAVRASLPDPLPEGALAVDYAPHAAVFPRAAAVVHQGGVGTLAQALRVGRPMLVVPFSHDQPDNAARARRLGVARVPAPARYAARTAARGLGALLADPVAAARAEEVGRAVRAKDGAAAACDAIEALLAQAPAR